MTNKAKVQAMYEAFGRGDVPAILEHLDENVRWEQPASPTDVPWLQPRDGRAGAAEFFASLQALEFTRFEVKNVLEDGDLVIGICDVSATVRANGVTFDDPDEAHLWRFNEAGLVTSFRHRVDTYAQWKAFHGER
jgi:ketosteroid isomerase-like protein